MFAGLDFFAYASTWGWQISLVVMYQKAKQKSVCMKPWYKQKSAVFTIEISSNDLINEACSKNPRNRCCISHNHLKLLAIHYEL